MKIFATFVIVLLGALGAFGGLLYAHALPTAKIAQSSTSAANALRTLGLYKPAAHASLATVAGPPILIPHASATDLAEEQQSLDAEKEQIEVERAALYHARAQKTSAAPTPAPAQIPAPPALAPMAVSTPLSPKLADIYNSMGADDLARIFAKEPDSDVVRSLVAMDERKAGKVMSSLPADRAAKVAALMDRSTADTSAAAGSGGPT